MQQVDTLNNNQNNLPNQNQYYLSSYQQNNLQQFNQPNNIQNNFPNQNQIFLNNQQQRPQINNTENNIEIPPFLSQQQQEISNNDEPCYITIIIKYSNAEINEVPDQLNISLTNKSTIYDIYKQLLINRSNISGKHKTIH